MHSRAESGLLTGDARLGLAAPGGPNVTSFDNPFEPAILLAFVAERVDQDLGVDMPLPASRESHVGSGELLGHHPEGKETDIGTQAQTRVRARNGWRVYTGAEEIGEVFSGKRRIAIVAARVRRTSPARALPRARSTPHLPRAKL